jgi:hypothetical protein
MQKTENYFDNKGHLNESHETSGYIKRTVINTMFNDITLFFIQSGQEEYAKLRVLLYTRVLIGKEQDSKKSIRNEDAN